MRATPRVPAAGIEVSLLFFGEEWKQVVTVTSNSITVFRYLYKSIKRTAGQDRNAEQQCQHDMTDLKA